MGRQPSQIITVISLAVLLPLFLAGCSNQSTDGPGTAQFANPAPAPIAPKAHPNPPPASAAVNPPPHPNTVPQAPSSAPAAACAVPANAQMVITAQTIPFITPVPPGGNGAPQLSFDFTTTVEDGSGQPLGCLTVLTGSRDQTDGQWVQAGPVRITATLANGTTYPYPVNSCQAAAGQGGCRFIDGGVGSWTLSGPWFGGDPITVHASLRTSGTIDRTAEATFHTVAGENPESPLPQGGQIALDLSPIKNDAPDIPPGPSPVQLPLYPGASPTALTSEWSSFGTPASGYVKAASADYLSQAGLSALEEWYQGQLSAAGFAQEGGIGTLGDGRTGVHTDILQFVPGGTADSSTLAVSLGFQAVSGGTLITYWVTQIVPPPRKADSYLPQDISRVDITETPVALSIPPAIHGTVTDPKAISDLVNIVNSLPPDPISWHSCPGETGSATLTAYPQGGNPLKVTVDTCFGADVAGTQPLQDPGGRLWQWVATHLPPTN